MPKQRPPQPGETAPDFSALSQANERIQLSDFRGQKRVVLVFYPADNTSLCTSQLCGFRDAWADLQSEDAIVLGVNPSNQSRHEQFAAKHSFPFPLLIDKGRKIAAAYGCVMALGLMVRRAVFVIDKEGRIAAYWQGNPAPVEVVEALRRLET